MPKNGFIKLHRTLLDWEWYQDSNVVRVFLHLILRANHTDQKWQGNIIKRGQLITSYEHLSQEIGDLSTMQIRTALDKLKLTGEITSQSNNLFTVITVNNYSTYQDVNKPVNKRITNEQQADNKRITTNKNVLRMIKNDKNISTDISNIKTQEGMKSLKDSLVKKGIIHEPK
ncbi:MAG TPA: hypothetical protein P5098_02145 [Candidatus Dojkabacteria bacterium]|nr:hypothetical protein [Candidatus Dojkabacteria bacterium]